MTKTNNNSLPAPDDPLSQPQENTSELPWYVAYTKPKQESCALSNLLAQNFNAYLPLYKKLKKPAKNAINQDILVVHEPMFPRYIFFQPSHKEQSIGKVQSTRGIVTLIRFGTELAIMPPDIIQSIRELEQQREEASEQDINPLKPGTRVRLNHNSSLQGLEGLVQTASSKRVIVLLEILGNTRNVKIKPNNLDII